MPAISYSYSINTVLASALQKALARKPVEQNYTHVASLAALEKHRERPSAAGYWNVPVSNAGTELGGPFDGADVTSTSGVDDTTQAQYRRAQYAEPVVILSTDEWDTSGEEALFKASVRKMDAARLRIRTGLNADVCSTSAVTKGIQGIPLAIEEAPSSSGAYGSISGNTYSWWRNQTDASNPSFTTGGMAALESMARLLQSVATEGAAFDWLLVSRNVYGFIQTAARTFLSLQAPATGAVADRARNAEMGWTSLSFHGKPIMFDANLTDGYAYFISNDALKLAVDPNVEFKLGEFTNLAAGGQHGRIAYLYWRGQLVTYERARLGQISTITA